MNFEHWSLETIAKRIEINENGIKAFDGKEICKESQVILDQLHKHLAIYKDAYAKKLAEITETKNSNVAVNETPAVGETSAAETTTSETKGEKNTMTNNTTITKENNTIKGEKQTMKNNKQNNNQGHFAIITNENLLVLEESSVFAQKQFGGNIKTLSQIIGSLESVKHLMIDAQKQQFIIRKEDSGETIQFGTPKGQTLISLISEFLPRAISQEDLKSNKVFKRLDELNLVKFKGVNSRSAKTKKRDNAIVMKYSVQKTSLVIGNEVVGTLPELAAAGTLTELALDENSQPKPGVRLVMAGDTRLNHMDSIHSVYQKQSMNAAFHKLAQYKEIEKQEIEVVTTRTVGDLAYSMKKSVSAYVFPNIAVVDGNLSLGLDESVSDILVAFAADNIEIVHRENGKLNKGEIIEESETIKLSSYLRSMAQARTKGAMAFASIEDAADFLLATGQLANAKMHKVDGVETGYYVIDLAKAYKRLFVLGSSGQLVDKGILSPDFIANCDVEIFKAGELHTFGEVEPAYVRYTHKKTGKTLTIALIEDFFTTLTRGENGENDFLINKLDKTKALQAIVPFEHWDNIDAQKILKVCVTDGMAMHNKRVEEAARKSKVLNSYSTFQFRFGTANKGNSLRFDLLTDYLQADIVLTESVVKVGFDPELLANEIKENGLLYYIVGQRKDSEDGMLVASQATQTYNFTKDELIDLYKESIKFIKESMDSRDAEKLMKALDVAKDMQENEFNTFDFLRIAKELPAVLNEQYFKDDVASLIVKKMNKLLDSRVYAKKARSRYMFCDPLAIFNALKRGSYTLIEEDKVLNHNEVIAPSFIDGKYILETGRAIATRFPCSVVHESPVVTAVNNEEYARLANEYGWGGLVFFDAKSWVVQRMAGADFDGDSCILIFDEAFVRVLERTQSGLFAGLRVLPCIDAYVIEDGLGFGTGCPTYVTEEEKELQENTKVEEIEVNDSILVHGDNVLYRMDYLAGENEAENRFEVAKAIASVANRKTIYSFESSLIGIIANQIMILTDLLSRSILTKEERMQVEIDILLLRTKGAWEIDRPKHGGAYLKMPIYVDQDERLSPLRFTEEELSKTKEEKLAMLADKKGALRYAFDAEHKTIDGEKVISGFKMKKPAWLASQKDEYGVYYKDSVFQQAYDFVSGTKEQDGALAKLCAALYEENKGANNNILNIVRPKIDLDAKTITQIQNALAPIYNAYSSRELDRSTREKEYKNTSHNKMREDGSYKGKNFDGIVSAKKNAKLRTDAEYALELDKFKQEKEILKAILRKEVYDISARNGWDVRYVVGALYMAIKSFTTNNKGVHTPYRMDGKEYRYVGVGSGNVSLCFETFGEEMKSLLLDDVKSTRFIPSDTNFVLVDENKTLIPRYEVKVRITDASIPHKNGAILNINAMKPISVTEQNGKPVINFYKGEQITMKGWSPIEASVGFYSVFVETIKFSDEKGVATVTFRAN